MKLFYKKLGETRYTSVSKTFPSREAAKLWLQSQYIMSGKRVTLNVERTPKGELYVTVNF